MCLACGHDLHIRADGVCIACGCAKKVDKWEAEKPVEKTVIPLKDLEASEK